MTTDKCLVQVPEDPSRLVEVPADTADAQLVLESLRNDSVVLVQGMTLEKADELMSAAAAELGLESALELQAGFAASRGHRSRRGRFYMTVSARRNYHFIPPHSEGTSFVGMQLASFFCSENSTDGGESILMNVDQSSPDWESLREKVVRGKLQGRSMTRGEIAKVRMAYRLDLPRDMLRSDDQVLGERETNIPGLRIVDALARLKKTYSRILDRELYSYWYSVGSIDLDSAYEFYALLRKTGLLKEPPAGLELSQIDNDFSRRIWQSGVTYGQLFTCKITRRLAPGDFLIQNNFSWTHAANNWTPGSGRRELVAAFA